MPTGKMIIEVYKTTEPNGEKPRFQFFPCALDTCMGRNGTAALDVIIRRGFENLPRKAQNKENQKEVLGVLAEAGLHRINLKYNNPSEMEEASVELSNVEPVRMPGVDARRRQTAEDSIIMSGRYSFSDTGVSTRLHDGQRLTIIWKENSRENDFEDDGYQGESGTVIQLNITYLSD